MDFIRDLPEQIAALWRQLELGSRIALVLVTIVFIFAVATVGYWSSRPNYVALASDLAPAETAKIAGQLELKNIGYKLDLSGSTLLVAESDLSQARSLVGEFAGFSPSASEGWNSGVFSDPESSRFQRNKELEASLARTIKRMGGIENATVHLAIANRSPFIRDQEPTTASAVLELTPSVVFTREQGAAVVGVIANGVAGLDPENVSVTDARGRILSSPSGYGTSDVTSQFEYVRRVESELASKANTMLGQLLGQERATVRVAADVDFNRLQRTETTYDPNLKVRTQEEIRSFSKTTPNIRTNIRTGGPAGTASNLGGRGTRDSAGAPLTETEDSNTTYYENAEIVDQLTEAPGRIKRLTVAVMADLSGLQPTESTADPAAPQPPQPTVSKAQVEAIVKQAVGFDAARGDEIEVLITQFATQLPDATAPPIATQWEFYNELIRNASLGLAALVALVLGILTLRRLTPISIRVDNSEAQTPSPDELLSSLSHRIQQNPDAMRSVISTWLNEQEPSETELTQPTERAA